MLHSFAVLEAPPAGTVYAPASHSPPLHTRTHARPRTFGAHASEAAFRPTDPYDSITRQVKKKMTLLSHRFQMSLDYSWFSGADSEKVWGKMYVYRAF